MVSRPNIELRSTAEGDFEAFRLLRKAVMRAHVVRQGLPWDDEAEDKYHRRLFDDGGLFQILSDGKRVGFVGLTVRDEVVTLGRFCLEEACQRRGIGTRVLAAIFAEPKWAGRKIVLDVLRLNPVRRLYEQSGFQLVGEDEKLAYYERPAQPIDPRGKITAALEAKRRRNVSRRNAPKR